MTKRDDRVSVELICGDALELAARLAGRKDVAIVSDPPYGIARHRLGGDCKSTVPLSRGRAPRPKPWAPIVGDDRPFDPVPWLAFPWVILWGANYYAHRLPPSRCWLVWDKREGTTPDNGADVELAWCSVDGVARCHRQLWRGLVMRGEENGKPRLHSAQKPVALMRWCIERLKLKPGTVVVDPYMGSGTTGVAAVQLGLPFIGCEIDPTHFATARRRIAAATPVPA
jgi:site-specific DNA-methyltransferase (adenine-specific)/modification methylase